MKSTAEVTDKLAIKPIYKDIIGQKILEEFDNTPFIMGSVARIDTMEIEE